MSLLSGVSKIRSEMYRAFFRVYFGFRFDKIEFIGDLIDLLFNKFIFNRK